MFEAYQVSIRLKLVNEVSAGLIAMSGQFGVANKEAAAFQTRLKGIKTLALSGAIMAGVGFFMAKPFIFAIDKAAELQKEMIGIQIATRGTTQDMTDMRKVIEGIAGQTVFSNIDIAKMGKTIATGTGLEAKQVSSLIPQYARFADVQLLMKGTSYGESVKEAIRLAHTAQHYDAASLEKYLDLLTKASMIVPGSLGEVGHALKYSQGMGKTALGINDENMVLMTALLNRLGFAGSRGGTNLIAAMTRTIPGVFGSGLLTGKSGEALRNMKFVDKAGHSNMFVKGKFDMFTWMGRLSEYIQKEFAKYHEAIARQHIMKNFQHAFGTQGARIASLLADPKALKQFRLIGETFKAYGGVENMQKKFASESVAQQWMNAKTNFISAMTELGITLLPTASEWLKKLNTGLQGLIGWIADNPVKVEILAKGFIALSASMMFGGSVLLLTAGFKGLGIALELFVGEGVLTVLATTSIPKLGEALEALNLSIMKKGGLIVAAGLAGYAIGTLADSLLNLATEAYTGQKGATPGGLAYDHTHDEYGKPKSAARGWIDKNIFGLELPHQYHQAQSPLASLDSNKFGIGIPNQYHKQITVYTTNNNIVDGRTLSQTVSKHQANAADKPTSGLTGVDYLMTPSPVAAF
jgi:TP901 family phage tail tape measure protein